MMVSEPGLGVWIRNVILPVFSDCDALFCLMWLSRIVADAWQIILAHIT